MEISMKFKNRIKKNRLFSCSIIMVLIMCLVGKFPSVAAESSSVYVVYTPDNSPGGNQVFTDQSQLLAEYELFSTEVSGIRNKYMLNLSNSDIAIEKQTNTFNYVEEINSNISNIKTTKSNLDKVKDQLLEEYKSYDQSSDMNKERLEEIEEEVKDIDNQLALLNNQLESGSSTLDNATASYQEALLNAELSKFYKENMQLILDYEINQLKFGVMKSLCNMMNLKEQINYYTSYKELLDVQILVENKKINLGLANEDNKDKLEIEKSINTTSSQACEDTYQASYNNIANSTTSKNSTYILKFSDDIKNYKNEELISEFIARNPELTQLRYYINAYAGYLSSTTSELSKNQLRYTINGYDIQRTLLTNQIRQYVDGLCADYKTVTLNITTSQKSIGYFSKQYQAIQKKYSVGRATQQDIKKANVNLQEAYMKYYTYEKDKVLIEYILDNWIYDVEYK